MARSDTPLPNSFHDDLAARRNRYSRSIAVASSTSDIPHAAMIARTVGANTRRTLWEIRYDLRESCA